MLKQIKTIFALIVTLSGLNSLEAKLIQVDFVADRISANDEIDDPAETIKGLYRYNEVNDGTDETGIVGSLDYSDLIKFELTLADRKLTYNEGMVYLWDPYRTIPGALGRPKNWDPNRSISRFVSVGEVFNQGTDANSVSVLSNIFFKEAPLVVNPIIHFESAFDLSYGDATLTLMNYRTVETDDGPLIDRGPAVYQVSSLSFAVVVPEPSTLGLLLFGVLGYSPKRS